MRNTALGSPPSVMAGVGLIEVLISVLVLGIGILGIAAMQATALRNSQSALDRSQATISMYTILDAMRANVATARSGGYNMGKTCTAPSAAGLVTGDQANWISSLKTTMGATACGTITCDAPASNVATCTITVTWDDSRGKDGSASQDFAIRTQL